MLGSDATSALDVLAADGPRLRDAYRLPWLPRHQQTVHVLRYQSAAGPQRPLFAAVVGGASSGKSTVFNNLLGGHLASQVTLKSHTTRGPILAAHEDHRDHVERWLDEPRLLLPTLAPQSAALDAASQGEPHQLVIVYHTTPTLRDVLLVDTPDFTSHAAEREGDLALTLLPWFDRLAVLVDHERWFDRQAVGQLREVSARLGQQRFVLFNRTCEGDLSSEERDRLAAQAERLAAGGSLVLDYRRGRGFRQFPPSTLRPVLEFLADPPPVRTASLWQDIAIPAREVLNANAERRHRLDRLGRHLDAWRARTVPSARECVVALMTDEERLELLDVVHRVLRPGRILAEWQRRTRQLNAALRRVPVVGGMLPAAALARPPGESGGASRLQIGQDWFHAACRRQLDRLNEEAATSDFWEEIRHWTGLTPEPVLPDLIAARQSQAGPVVERVDDALREWHEKVDRTCSDPSIPVAGALGATAVATLILLVAVPGPLGALTLPAAIAALLAVPGKLGGAALLGALSGRGLGRTADLLREKLLGSPEFDGVCRAAEALCQLIAEHGRDVADRHKSQAGQLVLPADEPLARALTTVAGTEDGP